MKRLLAILCAVVTVGACEPEAPNPRFDVIPASVKFWSERQDTLVIQLNDYEAERLDTFLEQNLHKTVDFYVGDTLVASPMVRTPTAQGALVFFMDDDDARARAISRLPSSVRKD